MENYDEFEYIDESKKKNRKGLLLFIIIIVLIIAAVIAVFHFADIDLPWIHKDEVDETEQFVEDLKKQNKTYNKDSDLIVPKFIYTNLYQRNGLNIDISELSANQNGYVFTLTMTNNSKNDIRFDCNMILIDGFQLDENFTIILNSTRQTNYEVTIPKTELMQYDIRDFNKLKFLGTILDFNTNKTTQINFTAETEQIEQVDNSKEGLLLSSKVDDLSIYFYKKVEDNTNYYLYFDIKNEDSTDNYNVMINRLLLNKKDYNPEKINILSHYQGEKIFFIKIPKKEITEFNNFDISFFVIKNYKGENQVINITETSNFSL